MVIKRTGWVFSRLLLDAALAFGFAFLLASLGSQQAGFFFSTPRSVESSTNSFLSSLSLYSFASFNSFLTLASLRSCSRNTPTVEHKRFRTQFFLTLLPFPIGRAHSRTTSADGTETVSLAWVTPREALESFHKGESRMFPPQWYQVRTSALAPAATSFLFMLTLADCCLLARLRLVRPQLTELSKFYPTTSHLRPFVEGKKTRTVFERTAYQPEFYKDGSDMVGSSEASIRVSSFGADYMFRWLDQQVAVLPGDPLHSLTDKSKPSSWKHRLVLDYGEAKPGAPGGIKGMKWERNGGYAVSCEDAAMNPKL